MVFKWVDERYPVFAYPVLRVDIFRQLHGLIYHVNSSPAGVIGGVEA